MYSMCVCVTGSEPNFLFYYSLNWLVWWTRIQLDSLDVCSALSLSILMYYEIDKYAIVYIVYIPLAYPMIN